MSYSSDSTRIYGADEINCPYCGRKFDAPPNNPKKLFCPFCGKPILNVTNVQDQNVTIQKQNFNSAKARSVVSKAFYVLIESCWVLFSIFISIVLYQQISSWGLVAYVLVALLFLYLFAPIAFLFKSIKKENYGVITFVSWLILSIISAIYIYNYTNPLWGLYASLATTILGFILLTVFLALFNKLFFDFPPMPKI
jgi:hypothetical protein